MYNELVAVTVTVTHFIVDDRIFKRCKVERNSVDVLQKTGTKINHSKVIMSV